VKPQHFIEEIGKAGVVQLYRLAPLPVLARTVAGDQVNLKIDGLSLVAETSRGEYLGQLEPRYGQRLIRLMEGGNRYSAAVVRSSENTVTIIIREVYQDPSQVGRISFPSKGLVGTRSNVGDMTIRREMEYEETLLGEPGYTVIGEEEPKMLAEEASDSNHEENGDNIQE